MRVLGLASYPIEAAATRYRLEQFVGPLAERNISLTIKPFLNSELFRTLYKREAMAGNVLGLAGSALRRVQDVLASRDFDVLLVQREAMLFGPPIVERLAMLLGGCPMVLDLDDATYVSYTSPTYGRVASWLKWFSKTDDLIRRAGIVTCGNRSIAEYVAAKGVKAAIIPTVVDTDRFRPTNRAPESGDVILGWVGTHSTFPYLESIFPVLRELSETRPFKLKIVGAGRKEIGLAGIPVENLEWSLEREIADFQSFDIGLYPIVSDEWAAGKSGFKAIQYMSVGIPYVVTPVAACAEIGEPGRTHLPASTPDEWYAALDSLLADAELRRQMGRNGREHAVRYYNVGLQADRLASALREAASTKGGMPG
jgi:glycosyltransferase involved in cell wall biosynthesis